MRAIYYLFFLIPFYTFAQQQNQISFNQLSVNDGLSQNSVVSIAQDSTGYLWFATQDGLNKYDGKQFTHYQKLFEDITRDTFSRLGKVYVDTNDQLYIITKNGLLEAYDRATDSFSPLPTFKNVSTVFQDTAQTTWIGTFGNGLYRIQDQDTTQLFRNNDIIKSVYAIAEWNDTVVVSASGAVFLLEENGELYTTIGVNENLHPINYSAIVATSDSDLWMGSFGHGLFRMSAGSKTLLPFRGFDAPNALPANLNIESLLLDTKGRLWIGTYGNGAYLVNFDSEKVFHFVTEARNPSAIHYNDILCIHQDYTGTIWLGTDGGGISYYDENLNKFNVLTNFQTPVAANVDVVRAIAVDTKQTIWIGTSGKGLTAYNPDTEIFTSYSEESASPRKLSSNRVMSLLSDQGKMWIGYQDAGLSVFDGSIMRDYTAETDPALPANTIWCIYKDTRGNTWLGSGDQGLIQFNRRKGVIKQYTYDAAKVASISSNNIRSITEGAPGELWIGTENSGVNRFFIEEEKFVRYDQEAIRNVKSLYYDAGRLWVGTNGQGLQAFETTSEKLKSYTVADGLPNNVIYGILPDALGNLWLSSNRGLSKMATSPTNDLITITNYDIYDGLQSFEFNTGAHYKDAGGNLYFGGLKGINWFHPENLLFNTAPPKTIITQLDVFNEAMPLTQNKHYKYNQNTLSFTFAGLHFSQPERNSYKYMLENYDETWSEASNFNYAHYTKLPSGSYRFKVLSSNYDDIWDTTPASYSFTIQPPWYLTLWAKILYVLLFLTGLFIVYSYLKSRWQMQLQLQLEHAETDRLKKLDELKSKLYTNISHEFRTPLTLISGPIQQLVASSGLHTKDKKALNIIEGSSERMLRLVNQLLDLSKLEEGSVTLAVGKHPITPQITQILEAFTLQANEKGISVNSEVADIDEAWYDSDVLEKVVSNLLSNAIKYAPENSIVSFTAKRSSSFLKIEVENENTSLSEKELAGLYERFYQADKNSEGVGIGLSLIKELVTLSKGIVYAEKKTPETISFIATLPIDKEQYNANALVAEVASYDFLDTAPVEIFDMTSEEPPILLVVEDNKEVRNYVVSLFSESCKVLQARNGLLGIQEAIKHIPDIIISDIMMPEKDGVELCNTLKQDIRTSHIPIILLTAKAGDTAMLEGLQNKADDYITKPFNAEILKQKVRNILLSRKELQKRYSQHVYLSPKDIAVTSYDEQFLESLQQIIDTKITQSDFTAEDFAGVLHVSRMQLHRKLKALTGLSTSEFIRSQRLKASINLLENSAITVAEIAYSVGFNTPSYFIKCFKEAYGTTPLEYNKK